MRNESKFGLGLLLGMAIGAAAAYLSDKDKRDELLEDVSTATDKAKDSLVEGYYEAKEKYQEYKKKLSKENAKIEEILEEEANEFGEDPLV